MSVGNRRKKRLLILAALGVTLVAGAGAAYSLRQRQLDGRAVAARDAGRAALTAGEYAAALDGLGRYLERFGENKATAEDYVLYARARRNVPAPNGGHLQQTINMLRKALEADPGCSQAKSDLLDVYVSVGYRTEALELLDSMLLSAPHDLCLLRTRCDVLAGLHRFSEALETANSVNSAAPGDLDGFVRTRRLRVASDVKPEDVDAWVDDVVASHRDDPGFELLRIPGLLGRNAEGATAEVNAILDRVLAATAASTDATLAQLLVRYLDLAGRFDDSLLVLGRTQDTAELGTRREIVRRLWYAGRAAEIPAHVERWGRDGTRGDPEIAALHALALFVEGRKADSEPLRKTLAGTNDAAGRAWSAFVEFAVRDTPADRGVVAALCDAVATVPESAILLQALGDAQCALGETGLAIRDWDAASKHTPIWSRPLLALARAYAATPGHGQLAEKPARAALKRSPHDIEVIRTVIELIASFRDGLDAKQVDELLGVLDGARIAAPQRADDLLPLRVELVLRRDRAKAEELLRAALTPTSTGSESTLLRLARIAGDAGIPLERSFLDLCESRHGVTPRLALSRAIARSRAADRVAGLAVFDELRTRATTGTSALEWDVVRTSYIDAAGLPQAGAAWLALAELHPSDLKAQLGSLGSACAWANRAAIVRVIDRVKAITGDEGTTWRVARARWVLSGPSATDAEIAEVASMLDGVIRVAPGSEAAHQLLAGAFERLGNLAGAERELRLAESLAPEATWIALEMARIAQQQGHSEEARRELDRALAAKELRPEQTERAAYLLAAGGDTKEGAGLLETLESRSQTSRSGAFLLARLCARLGETDRAVRLCEQLLATPDPDVVELAADLYASVGRNADADAVIARLDASNAPPGDRELVRARHLSPNSRSRTHRPPPPRRAPCSPRRPRATALAGGRTARRAPRHDDPSRRSALPPWLSARPRLLRRDTRERCPTRSERSCPSAR